MSINTRDIENVAHVLIGSARNPNTLDINKLTVRVTHAGEQIGYRDGAKAQGDLWEYVLWVVNDFVLKNGYTIEPDHIIIPGNLTGLHPGKPGDYRADFGELGAIDFTITSPK